MQKYLLRVFLLPVLLTLVCCASENINSKEPEIELNNLVVYDGFETDVLNWKTHTARESNITRDDIVQARSGNYAIKIEVFKSDPWIANGPRSEVFRPKGIDYWLEGDEIWIGGSILFPENYIDDPMPEIIWQVHGDKTDPYVPFLIQVINDDLIIKGKGISDNVYEIKKGQWVDIVVHLLISLKSHQSNLVE